MGSLVDDLGTLATGAVGEQSCTEHAGASGELINGKKDPLVTLVLTKGANLKSRFNSCRACGLILGAAVVFSCIRESASRASSSIGVSYSQRSSLGQTPFGVTLKVFFSSSATAPSFQPMHDST